MTHAARQVLDLLRQPREKGKRTWIQLADDWRGDSSVRASPGFVTLRNGKLMREQLKDTGNQSYSMDVRHRVIIQMVIDGGTSKMWACTVRVVTQF